MLINLLITSLFGSAAVFLLEKWKVDNYMNTHPFFSRFWPADPCLLCRGFWWGCVAFTALSIWPVTIYLFTPFAAIPGQLLLLTLIPRKSYDKN